MIMNVLCFIHAWNWMMNGGVSSVFLLAVLYISISLSIWWLLSGCPVHIFHFRQKFCASVSTLSLWVLLLLSSSKVREGSESI